MDKKVLQDVKEANKKLSEGSLALFNARLDALANVGRDKDLVDYLMRRKEGFVFGDQPTNDNCNCPPTNANCPCPEGGPKVINQVCPPQCEEPDPQPDDTELSGLVTRHFNEMSGIINILKKDIEDIKNRLK